MTTLRGTLHRVPGDTAVTASLVVLAVALAAASTATAYALHPLAFPLAAGALAFVVGAFARPALGLAGAGLALPLEAVNLPLASGALSPAEAALTVVAAGWAGRILLRPESVAKPSMRDASLIALLVIVALGLLVAVDPAPVLRVAVSWTLFYFVYLQAQSLTAVEIRTVLIAFLVGAGVLGVLGAATFLQSGNTQLLAGGAITGERAVGTFTGPNYYASALGLALLPGLAVALGGLRRHLWLLLPAAGALAGLIFSLSRGATLGLAVGLLLLLAWRRARRAALLVAAVVVVLTLANANPLVSSEYFGTVEQRLATLQHPTRESNRPQIWSTAIGITVDHPFIGVGVNQFKFEGQKRSLYERGAVLENAHNIFLSLAAETGLLGLAAFVVFVGQLVARGVRAASTADPLRLSLALGLVASLTGFMIQGLTAIQLRVPVLAGMFFLFAGLLTALADRAARES